MDGDDHHCKVRQAFKPASIDCVFWTWKELEGLLCSKPPTARRLVIIAAKLTKHGTLDVDQITRAIFCSTSERRAEHIFQETDLICSLTSYALLTREVRRKKLHQITPNEQNLNLLLLLSVSNS